MKLDKLKQVGKHGSVSDLKTLREDEMRGLLGGAKCLVYAGEAPGGGIRWETHGSYDVAM